MPPQPFPEGVGNVIWPMKSVVGGEGRAMPKANWLFAPKKRWNVMLLRGSVNAAVIAAGLSSPSLSSSSSSESPA